MTYLKKSFFFFINFIFFLTPITAQNGTFEAKSSRQEISVGERFEVFFILNNLSGEHFQPPAFNDFKIVGGPNQSMSSTMINGNVTRSVSISYDLLALKKGNFTIGPASVIVKGKILKTQTISIVVDNNNKKNNIVPEGTGKQDVFIRAEISDKDAVIGQQLSLDYKLFTRFDIGTKTLINESDYKGFFQQTLEQYSSEEIVNIKGKRYIMQLLKRVSLYPQQQGLFTIEPMKIRVDILEDSPISIFGRNAKPLDLQSNPITINVTALPESAPASFNGAVGHFTLKTSSNRTTATTDEAVALKMEIVGDGDPRQIGATKLNLPPEIEVYEPKIVVDRVGEFNGKIEVTKQWEYQLLPTESGNYDIKPEFSYYDIQKKRYLTLAGDPFHLAVTQGKGNNKTVLQQTNIIKDIHYLHEKTNFIENKKSWLAGNLFWILFGLPLVALSAIGIFKYIQNKKLNIDIAILKRQKAKSTAQKRLTAANQLMKAGNTSPFYKEITNAITGYVADKCNISAAGLIKEDLQKQLLANNTPPEQINECLQILKVCELALFSGTSEHFINEMPNIYQKTMTWIDKMES